MFFGGFRGQRCLFLSFSSPWGGLDLEWERRLLSCLRQEGLGEPGELPELELRDVLELPERLDAEDELEPELEVELDRDLVLLLPLEALRLFRVLSPPPPFSLDSFIFRAILGLLIRAVFAFGRSRSPCAGLVIIFFDS